MIKNGLIFVKLDAIKQCCKMRFKNFDENKFNIFAESIRWKLRRAKYHIAAYKVCLRDYLRKKAKNKIVYTPREEYFERAAFEIEALIETLNSLFEILFQLINLVLKLGLREEDVSSGGIIKKLPIMSRLRNKIDLMGRHCDKNFAYVRSVCNIIKHRKILNWKGKIRFPIGGRINNDILLQGFSDAKTQNGSYTERYAKELCQKIYPGCIDLFISCLRDLADVK